MYCQRQSVPSGPGAQLGLGGCGVRPATAHTCRMRRADIWSTCSAVRATHVCATGVRALQSCHAVGRAASVARLLHQRERQPGPHPASCCVVCAQPGRGGEGVVLAAASEAAAPPALPFGLPVSCPVRSCRYPPPPVSCCLHAAPPSPFQVRCPALFDTLVPHPARRPAGHPTPGAVPSGFGSGFGSGRGPRTLHDSGCPTWPGRALAALGCAAAGASTRSPLP